MRGKGVNDNTHGKPFMNAHVQKNAFLVSDYSPTLAKEHPLEYVKKIRQVVYAKPPYVASFRAKDNFKTVLCRPRVLPTEQAFESCGQKWIYSRSGEEISYRDQYGFMILKRGNTTFELYHAQEFVISVYTQEAAKAISLVLLNDKMKCPKNIE